MNYPAPAADSSAAGAFGITMKRKPFDMRIEGVKPTRIRHRSKTGRFWTYIWTFSPNRIIYSELHGRATLSSLAACRQTAIEYLNQSQVTHKPRR